MTNPTYTNIISAIDTIVGGVTGVVSHFQYEPQQMTAYPAVTITPIGHNDKFNSLRDTERTYSFMVRVWGQMDNTREDTPVVIRNLADAIIDALGSQANMSLGGLIAWSNLTAGKFVYVQKEASYYVAELTYTAIVNHSRY